MYLSRIKLDITNRNTLRALNAPSKFHGAVESAFPGERKRRLWRLDRIGSALYCDAMASWQKPHVENNHHLIRRILPKGTSFETLTQDQFSLMMNHINNYTRENLNGKSPYECIRQFIGPKTVKLLGLRKSLLNRSA